MKTLFVVAVAIALIATAGSGMAAGTNTLTVTASVAGTCKFVAATSTLGFGSLDPTVGTDVNASTPVQFWCTKGVITDAVSADMGLNPAGGKRGMKDSVSGDIIPYTLALAKDANPNAGPSTPRTLTLTGGVLGADYTSKTAGSYSDTVVVSIDP